MKRIITMVLLLAGATVLTGQTNSVKVSTSEFSFDVRAQGGLFLDDNQNGFVDSLGRSLFFASNVLYNGLNANGDIKGLFESYNTVYNSGTINSNSVLASNPLVKVTRVEVEAHINNYQNPGYIMPAAIAQWPGSGNTTIGELAQMAPYVDLNQNNTYDPENGDYPNIIGDMAVYLIRNDKGINPESIGLEMHHVLYIFEGEDEVLNHSVIHEVKMYNRGQEDLSNFRLGFFVDYDLGGVDDDYFASDSAANAIIGYNGDDYDFQFKETIPGVVFGSLFCDVQGLNNVSSRNMGENLENQHKLLNNKWSDGECWMKSNGGVATNGSPTRFILHGDIEDESQWNESRTNNSPGDRRALLIQAPREFKKGDSFSVLNAYTYRLNPDTLNHLFIAKQAVNQLGDIRTYLSNNYSTHPSILSAQNCGEIQEPDCQATSIDELNAEDFVLYPNPSEGKIWVESQIALDAYVVYDVSGLTLKQGSFSGGEKQEIDLSGLAKGMYYIKLVDGTGGNLVKSVVIK